MQIRQSEPTLPSADLDPLFGMHAELCKALANEHRLKIMYALCHGGEKCVSELATEVGISVHNVSQHLRVLKQRLLVRSRKEGQSVYYSITNMKFMEACGLMRQALWNSTRRKASRCRRPGASTPRSTRRRRRASRPHPRRPRRPRPTRRYHLSGRIRAVSCESNHKHEGEPHV